VGRVCELVRVKGLTHAYDLKEALERRGIEAQVWGAGAGGMWRSVAVSDDFRLVVYAQDVVYARWVLYGAGLDPWPDVDYKEEDEASVG
jgi:hypothetical protein